jgi:hypothetical protein
MIDLVLYLCANGNQLGQNYTLAMKLVVKDKEMQVATLLCAIGKEPDKVHACPHISMD